jgi:hypothetical protein
VKPGGSCARLHVSRSASDLAFARRSSSVLLPCESLQLLLTGHQPVAAHACGMRVFRAVVTRQPTQWWGALAAKLLDWCPESGDVCQVVKVGASSDHCSTRKWAAEQQRLYVAYQPMCKLHDNVACDLVM